MSELFHLECILKTSCVKKQQQTSLSSQQLVNKWWSEI